MHASRSAASITCRVPRLWTSSRFASRLSLTRSLRSYRLRRCQPTTTFPLTWWGGRWFKSALSDASYGYNRSSQSTIRNNTIMFFSIVLFSLTSIILLMAVVANPTACCCHKAFSSSSRGSRNAFICATQTSKSLQSKKNTNQSQFGNGLQVSCYTTT